MSDRIQPEVADGKPIVGEPVAVVDESSPANAAGGVAYVVSVSAVFSPTEARIALAELFPPDRTRPFHWAKEGPRARERMIEIAGEIGVTSVAFFAHVGRSKQITVRSEILERAALHVAGEGVDHLIVEASDRRTVRRDQDTTLDTFHDRDGVPFDFDWRSKSEPLLWIADAIAGAVGEYLVDKERRWFDELVQRRVVSLLQHP